MSTRRLLEKLYEDEMTVYRVTYNKVDGLNQKEKVCIGEKIICGLSFGGEGKSAQSSNAHSIDYDVTIFATPELDIQQGDILEVSRCGKMFEYDVIGYPQLYPDHQEIHGKGRGLA